jgi:hypothetical protein
MHREGTVFVEREKKVRLSQLAKDWNVESKVLIDLCQQLGIPAASQSAGLGVTEVTRLREAVRKRTAQPATPKPAAPQPVKPAQATAKPVPASLVAPVPAPVWNKNVTAPAAAKSVPAVPPTPPPAAKPAAAPVSPPVAAPPPVGVRNPTLSRSAQPLPDLPTQQKNAPASVPVTSQPVVSAGAPEAGSAGAVGNPGIEHLLAVGGRAGFQELDLIPRLAEIDTSSAVFKIQQVTERLCRRVIGSKEPRALAELITEIEQRKLLGKKAVSYLHHLQNLGDHAAHKTDESREEEFTLVDVNNAAATLASVMEAALRAKRLETH